jgi:branched-subunit amino acid transport protein
MSPIALILLVAAGTFATRLTGFLIGDRPVPLVVDRSLEYVPMAVFAALITPDLASTGGDLTARLTGVIVAGAVVLRVRQLWAGLLGGMAVYLLLRALLG